MGSDLFLCTPTTCGKAFQSTLPVWGATTPCPGGFPYTSISIHAPRVGSDPSALRLCALYNHFNPRSPCGERPAEGLIYGPQDAFQSTLPVWGATSAMPREVYFTLHFNPRSPCGERQQKCLKIFLRKTHNFVRCTKPKMFASAYRPSRQIFYGIFPKIRCEPP